MLILRKVVPLPQSYNFLRNFPQKRDKILKTSMSYFKNLFLALLGRDPYGDEVKELREQMKKAEENVNALRGMQL